jgi:hypothetical protein
MQWAMSVRNRLTSVSGALKPCIRVIGLVYTGLAGMLAMVLVVSVALIPVTPALQQIAEPARQAVSNFVQPTSDVVTSMLGGVPVHVEPVAQLPSRVQRSFSDAVSLDVTIQGNVEDSPLEQAAPVVVASPPIVRALPTQEPTPDPDDVELGLEPDQISAPRPLEAVVVRPAAPVLQIASEDAPKPLPTLPVPTETPLQIKARLDAENQAAIDAAKAARVRAKAEADAANEAAIAASKGTPVATAAPAAALVEATRAPTTTPLAPTPAPASPVASPQSKAAADAANQAAIDAAKAARARAKAEADAANAAALRGATGAQPTAKATLAPTAQPTPPAQPTPQPPPTISVVEMPAAPPVNLDVVEQRVDESSLLETAPIDQAASPSDTAAV